MEIRIDSHTLKRAIERGAEESEIRDVLTNIENGASKMQIFYDERSDLLYLRLDDQAQDVINQRVSDNIVLDVGKGEQIVGIEILDASKHLKLERLLPIEYQVALKYDLH